MQTEPENFPREGSPSTVGAPGPSPAGTPPPLPTASPPPLPAEARPQPARARQTFVLLLSLCLGLFLADGVVSLLDDSLILFLNIHVLSPLRGLVWLATLLLTGGVYLSMAFAPMIPRRLFLPVTLFGPLATLAMLPAMIFFFPRIQQIIWLISFLQVVLGLMILRWCQPARGLRWPLVPERALGPGQFGWRRLWVFLLVNAFVLVPGILVYLCLCAAMAVNHLTGGFLSLRPGGLVAHARKYVRQDGRAIQLYPMAHVGDAEFYRRISQSFPSNSVILMEGVTDDKNLLTNNITYKRMAQTLGLAEQQKEFKPPPHQVVMADVDVSDFARDTIDLLNLAMLVHAQGVNPETLLQLTQYAPPPHFEKTLFDDLLGKRNRHLLKTIRAHLGESDPLVVPWGAAHMPEVAREIQQAGFRLEEIHDYVAIRFGAAAKARTNP